MTAQILQLLSSAVHRYVGRPDDGPEPAPPGEIVDHIELRAGLGVVGDRYFGKTAHKDASVTLIAAENLPRGADLVQTRRNILTRGIDVDALVGRVLTLDSGDGPVSLSVRRAARPCSWLDVAIAPGTWKALRDRGGVRCVPLTSGTLRVGPVDVSIGQ